MLNLEVNSKLLPKKITLILVETQQLPDIEEDDSKDENPCLKWTIYNGRRKRFMNFQTDTDKMNNVVYRYRNNTYLEDTERDLKLTEYKKLLAKRGYLLSYTDVFYKRCIVLDETTVHKKKQTPSRIDVLFLISVFRLYLGFKMSFENNSVRENLLLSACFCWDSGLSSREMNQKKTFGGLISYGNSCLVSIFRYSKVFILHAVLHDAAGAVRSHSGKGTGYCYMIGRGPKFIFAWSHDWTTLLPLRKTLSTLHVQLCQLLKQYVFHENRYEANGEKHKELRLFLDGSLEGFSFCPPKTFKPKKKQTTWNTRPLHRT